MQRLCVLALTVFAFAFSAAAQASLVTYEVRSPYSAGNFSASWLHQATGCNSLNSGLYMCGAKQAISSGQITGNQSGGVLHVTGGVLNGASETVQITGGRIGGAFGWTLETLAHGTFEFVDLSALSGSPFNSGSKPNSFNTGGAGTDNLVLWGQNFAAPGLSADPSIFTAGVPRWGLDLYAVKVPEPATLALWLCGIAGLVLVRRRRLA